MSHYPQDDSYDSYTGGRPLSGAGLNLGYVPGNLDSFQQPYPPDSGGLSEGESQDVMMPYMGGGDERRNSLTAMGDMLRAGPIQSGEDEKKKSKKDKKKDKDTGGRKFPKPPSIDVRGSFRKIKGKFSRGKENEPLQHAASHGSIEVHEQNVPGETRGLDPHMMPEITPPGSGYATPSPFDPHPGGYDLNPTDTLPRREPSKMDSMKSSVKGWFYPSVPTASPSRYSPGDVAELKPMPKKSPIRMSTIIYVLLGLGLIIGIILTAFSSQGSHYAVIGPLFLGLSIFAIIGKVFFTLFWEDEPCPKLRPYITNLEDVIGGAKDPYRLKQPIKSNTTMPMPQMSPTAVPLNAFNYTYTYPTYPDPSAPAMQPNYQAEIVGYKPPEEHPQRSGYRDTYDYDDQEEMPLGARETVDTKMGVAQSREMLTEDYDGADTGGGYLGPAGRSTPTYYMT